MIAFLRGLPRVMGDDLILEVNGVGYGVLASPKVLLQAQNSQKKEAEIELYIYTHVREDKLELYGFLSLEDKRLFELVTGVSGVGPSIALQLIDRNPEELVTAVQEANVSFFKNIPRVGKKLAQKIIIELRGKLGQIKELNLAPLSPKLQTVADALASLGWDEEQVRQAIDELNLEEMAEEEAIRFAIKQFGKK